MCRLTWLVTSGFSRLPSGIAPAPRHIYAESKGQTRPYRGKRVGDTRNHGKILATLKEEEEAENAAALR